MDVTWPYLIICTGNQWTLLARLLEKQVSWSPTASLLNVWFSLLKLESIESSDWLLRETWPLILLDNSYTLEEKRNSSDVYSEYVTCLYSIIWYSE